MRTRRIVLLLAALALFTTACGSRLSDAQVAALNANGGAGAAAGGAAVPTGSEGASGAANTPVASAGATGGGAGTTGGGSATGATGGGGAAAAAGPGSCTATPGSKDPGVSDTEVKFGNVSTISGPIPGFGQTGVNGAKAYFNYLNSQGGICGRKLTLVTADDRLDAGTNRSAYDSLKDQVFGFVGGTTVVDDGGTGAIQGTNISDCGLAIGTASIASPTKFSPNPIDPSGTTNGTTGIWSYFKAAKGVTKVGIIVPAQPDARTRGHAYIQDIQQAGLAVGGPYEVPVTGATYAGVIAQMQSDGVDAVITTLEVNEMSKLAIAMQQAGFKPKVPFYGAQAYGQQFLKLAGDAANGTVLGLTYDIIEDKGSNPAAATFADWYQRTNPGSDPDFFAIMGWAAADMCTQALLQAGGAPTRDAQLKALQGMSAFDAHGLLSPRNPAGKSIGNQFMVTEVQNGQWVRTYPASGFGTGG